MALISLPTVRPRWVPFNCRNRFVPQGNITDLHECVIYLKNALELRPAEYPSRFDV